MGLKEIPLEFIVGTSSGGRTRTFARNFMPVLDEESEFASKWKNLCNHHLKEGIRDPITVWEYMNRFYVQEGNKRVSVLKFFDAVKVSARVKRIMPRRDGDPEVEKYYTFLSFCDITGTNFIECTKSVTYEELLSLLDREKGNKEKSEEHWSARETGDFVRRSEQG